MDIKQKPVGSKSVADVFLDTTKKPSSKAAGKNQELQNPDFNVQLSTQGRTRTEEQQKAFKIARDTPSVDEAKIARLKAEIESGTYKADSAKIADGMLREAIKDRLSQEA